MTQLQRREVRWVLLGALPGAVLLLGWTGLAGAKEVKMQNIQHSTFNVQHPIHAGARLPWALNVECWVLNVPIS